MQEKYGNLGFNTVFNPGGDGKCFYSAATYQLGTNKKKVKDAVFGFLKSHRFDVSMLKVQYKSDIRRLTLAKLNLSYRVTLKLNLPSQTILRLPKNFHRGKGA